MDRERSRSRLLLAAFVVVVLTLALPQPGQVHWPAALLAVAAIAATWTASLVPALWPAMNRVGGVVTAVEIAALVAATGGPRSPYSVLYGMLLLYTAVFYGTRRLLLTGVVVAAAAAAPHAWPAAPGTEAEGTELLIRLAVWAGTCAVAHGLVTQLRRRTRQLREQEQRYRSLFDHNPNAVYSMDTEGRFTSANAVAHRLMGAGPGELIGDSVVKLAAPDDAAETARRFAAALDGHPQNYWTSVVDRQGRRVEVSVSNLPIMVDGRVVGVYGIAKDISELKALQDTLAHQALHDPLTGLANRTLLADHAELAIADSTRSGKPVALLMLDLDGFKQVNDTLGHAAGDDLLVEVAARLRRCTRPADTLARLGGDEFALVLPNTDTSSAAGIAERILSELAPPVSVAGQQITLAASIGIVVDQMTGREAAELLAQADAAMYAAKRAGKGRYELFHPALRHPESLPGMRTADARAWAAYMAALRAEITDRKQSGLPTAPRAPAVVHRTLEQLLAAIAALPPEAAVADLALPTRVDLEAFVFHQSAVDHWANTLVQDGTLTTRCPRAADRFWAYLQAWVVSAAPCDEAVAAMADTPAP
ncbi:diguanylate cyclase domain-containing protein [Blastococcus saxobsidens]|uniref:diguanylate cyclase domain-containing protein n=1 Tax=Blastococcus saxobsidens TaxID=138336 RepID=UPI0002F75A47|nr:diguanylate cyclase [Blastococcus saxobsidens]